MGRIVGGLGGLIGEAMGINESLVSLELYGLRNIWEGGLIVLATG